MKLLLVFISLLFNAEARTLGGLDYDDFESALSSRKQFKKKFRIVFNLEGLHFRWLIRHATVA